MPKEAKEISKFQKIFDYKCIVYDILKLTGVIPVLLDLRLKKIYISGKRPKDFPNGKFIVSSNHMSYEDPVIISNVFWQRRIGFVATSELFNTKTKNFFFKAFGCIPIDKSNPKIATFKEVEERLKRGHLVGVFPEGIVSNDDNMKTFKSGIVMMAVMAEAPILPIYIGRRTSRLHRQVAIIGEKIDYKDFVKGPFPTMDELENITRILAQKEYELEIKYLEIQKED